MGAIATIIAAIVEALLGITKITRENIAASLDEIAAKVRNGELIPQEAIDRATSDQDRIDAHRKKLGG